MIPQQIDLTPLKGLHLMDQPSWWPLAYGWWVILAVLIVLCLAIFIVRKWWLSRPLVYASHEIKSIQIKNLTDLDFLHALSDLMKRVAIFQFGRETISQLTEEKWQRFILKQTPVLFSKDQAKLIAFSPYLTQIKRSIDRPLFAKQVEEWIRQVLKKQKSS